MTDPAAGAAAGAHTPALPLDVLCVHIACLFDRRERAGLRLVCREWEAALRAASWADAALVGHRTIPRMCAAGNDAALAWLLATFPLGRGAPLRRGLHLLGDGIYAACAAGHLATAVRLHEAAGVISLADRSEWLDDEMIATRCRVAAMSFRNACTAASGRGHLGTLRWLVATAARLCDPPPALDGDLWRVILNKAILGGHADVVAWTCEQRPGMRISEGLAGSLDRSRWVGEWGAICLHGFAGVAQALIDAGVAPAPEEWEKLATAACTGGHLQLAQWCFRAAPDVMRGAAHGGHFVRGGQ